MRLPIAHFLDEITTDIAVSYVCGHCWELSIRVHIILAENVSIGIGCGEDGAFEAEEDDCINLSYDGNQVRCNECKALLGIESNQLIEFDRLALCAMLIFMDEHLIPEHYALENANDI